MATFRHSEYLDHIDANEADYMARLEEAQHVLTLVQLCLIFSILASLYLVLDQIESFFFGYLLDEHLADVSIFEFESVYSLAVLPLDLGHVEDRYHVPMRD